MPSVAGCPPCPPAAAARQPGKQKVSFGPGAEVPAAAALSCRRVPGSGPSHSALPGSQASLVLSVWSSILCEQHGDTGSHSTILLGVAAGRWAGRTLSPLTLAQSAGAGPGSPPFTGEGTEAQEGQLTCPGHTAPGSGHPPCPFPVNTH